MNHSHSRPSCSRAPRNGYQFLVLAAALCTATPPLDAANFTWTGANATDAGWNRASNWDAAPTFNNTADIIFNSSGALQLSTFTQAARTIRSLTFNADADSAVTIRTTTTAGGTTAANLTFDTDTVGGNAIITVESGATGNHIVGTGGGSVALADNLNVVHNGSGTLTFNRNISGAFAITKTGSGEMVLGNIARTFSGGLNINEGAVRSLGSDSQKNDLGADGSTVTLGGGTLVIDALNWAANKSYDNLYLATTANTTSVLDYDNTSAAARNFTWGNSSLTTTLNGNLVTKSSDTQGANVIVLGQIITGAGRLSHEGNNDFAANYSDRRLQISNANNSAGWSGEVEARKGAIQFTAAGAVTTGNLTIGEAAGASAAGLSFSGDGSNNYANQVTVRSGSGLRVMNTTGNIDDTTWSGNFTLDGNLTFSAASTAGSDTISGNISGAGGLIKIGDRKLTLAGTNSYNGTTTISAGTLQVGDGSTTGSLGAGDITNNATLVFDRSNAISVANDLSGNGSLTKEGAARLTLTGANTMSGNITINNGQLRVTNVGAGTGAIAIASGALFEINYTTGSRVYANNISGDGGITKVGGALVALKGNITSTGNIMVNDGTVRIDDNALQSTANLVISASGTLKAQQAAGVDASWASAISGGGSFDKQGDGNLTLTGNNTHTGDTDVTAGKLIVSGSLASSSVTVDLGAILGGNGTLGGATTINGTHTPGNSVGTQTFSSSLDYGAASTLQWELASNTTSGRGTNFDAVDVAGALGIDGAATIEIILGVDFNSSASFWTTTQTWDIFDVTGDKSTTFANFDLFNASAPGTPIDYSPFGSFSYGYTGNNGTLTWAPVPEPRDFVIIGALLAAGFGIRRRRIAGFHKAV